MLKCHACKQYLPTGSFWKRVGTPRGHQDYCGACTKNLRAQNKLAREPTRNAPSRAILYFEFNLNG